MRAVKQAHAPVGIAFPVLEPASQKTVAARHGVNKAARRLELLGDSLAKLLAHALVRVHTQNPIMARGLDGELLLRAEPKPLLLDHARAVAGGELERAVGGARVHHDDLLGESDTIQAALELRGGVAGDDGYGQVHGAKEEPANPYNQRLMRGILTAFRALRPDGRGRP